MVLLLAEGLLARGHEVELILFNGEGEYSRSLPDGLRLATSSGERSRSGSARGSMIGAYWKIAKALGWRLDLLPSPGRLERILPVVARLEGSRMRPDIALFNKYGLLADAVFASFLLRSPPAILHANHGTGNMRDRPGRVRRHRRLLQRSAIPVIAVSRGVSRELRDCLDLPPNRVRTRYNGIDSDGIAEKSRQVPDHPWLRESKPSPPVILGVGRLDEGKDHLTLIRSFAVLRKRIQCRLLILGEGSERGRLQSLIDRLGIGDDVDLPGWKRNPFACMGRSGAFALASTSEGLPTVLLEALACGCPCVSTDCDHGPREILGDGRFGALVPVGDHEAMAGALEDALRNPPSREKLRDRAGEFSLERCVRGYEELFREAADGTFGHPPREGGPRGAFGLVANEAAPGT